MSSLINSNQLLTSPISTVAAKPTAQVFDAKEIFAKFGETITAVMNQIKAVMDKLCEAFIRVSKALKPYLALIPSHKQLRRERRARNRMMRAKVRLMIRNRKHRRV